MKWFIGKILCLLGLHDMKHLMYAKGSYFKCGNCCTRYQVWDKDAVDGTYNGK